MLHNNSSRVHIHREDLEPDLTALSQFNPARYPYLLESVAQGQSQARYDILFAFPQESLQLNSNGNLVGPCSNKTDGFLNAFDRWWKTLDENIPSQNVELPFVGGWFIFLSYELVGEIEPGLTLPGGSDWVPIALAVRCPAAAIVDHLEHCIYLVSEQSSEQIDMMRKDLVQLASQPAFSLQCPEILQYREDAADRYLVDVDRIKRYIIEGDVFQVNLSRQWQIRFTSPVDPLLLYRLLRRSNPAPFSGFVRFDGTSLVSSSPERLVSVRGGRVQTRPIAGTRPRGTGQSSDIHYSRELLAHPKERAEHVMLIDLERNDLGRVCKAGSISVNELMKLESYTHVHHIVSNVQGELREEITPSEVIKAVFPGGTITGCPKVRCMEIIAELENSSRGAYTGSMGYINRNGDMDLNILIRSMVIKEDQVVFRAGAGIVYDSIADRELEETRAKARGLLQAVGLEL